MPEYSPLVILFICMHLISLCLLSFHIYIILKTGSYITKWTLFQLSICLFIMGLSNLPVVIKYGNNIQQAAGDPLCIAQDKVVTIIYCPLKLFSGALCIYLFAVARFNHDLEQKYFWHMSASIWIITILMNAIGLKDDSKKNNWGVQPGSLFCKSTPSNLTWYVYVIPTSVLTIMAVFITVHSSCILWNRWRNFNQKQSRRTAINLGYAVRLTVLSGCYSIILLVSLILSIAEKVDRNVSDGDEITFLDFSPSFFGTILFMIFGTTKSAAIFLPCCYYVPPKDRKKQQNSSIISQQYYSNDENLPYLNDSVDFDADVKRVETVRDEIVSTSVTISDDYTNEKKWNETKWSETKPNGYYKS